MADSPASRGEKWRILCVDDDPEVLEVLRITLSLKHEVVLAEDGIEAVGLLDLCEPDLVLCDVRMPKMDGFQTVEAIRRHPRFFNVPVFFLTAEKQRTYAERGFSLGANLYLTKPFDPERVLKSIDYFLEECGRSPRDKRLSLGEIEEARQGPSPPTPGPEPEAEAAEAPAAAEPEAPGPAGALPRVMVISHVQPELERVRAALEGEGEAVAGADPLASLHQLFRYDPDLLIVNPGVPQLSGWDLAQLVRRNAQVGNVPILLVEDIAGGLDPRLIPTISDQPPLPAGALPDHIQASVRRVTDAPSFQTRPKRASLEALLTEEEDSRRTIGEKGAGKGPQEVQQKERYERIQAFIDTGQE